MHESYSNTGAYYVMQNSQFTLHFSYSIYDAHLRELFELRLIFGFEQSSFDYENKPILTSLNEAMKVQISSGSPGSIPRVTIIRTFITSVQWVNVQVPASQ